MAVERLLDPKLKTLGVRGIECIFVGYVEHSKAFKFYVIKPNDSVSINSIIESRDDIFDDNRFSSVLRPSLKIPKGTKDISGSVVPKEVTEEVVQQHEPELRKSKRNRTPKNFGPEFQLYLIEGTRDESLTNTLIALMLRMISKHLMKQQILRMLQTSWLGMDLQRKLKLDGTIEKFKTRMIDVKTAFLNGELDEEVYMNQPQGFIMLGNENKVCKLIKSLYRLKVDLTKEFLSSRFSMKDKGEADVILGIRIKHKSNGIAISQSHYIKDVLKKFNYFECTPVSTPMDTSEKLMPDVCFYKL
ncbi:zinc finger, CCHC-type containing protein [Tanacetum coccineum]